MNVTPIPTPLPGEGLVGLQPAAAPIADAGWHRHLNLFTGRALTAPALTAEQLGRVGRLAASGQAVSPGVVSGLETQFITGADHPPILQVSAGRGITQSGEDVVIPSPVHIVIDDLPVYGPVTLFGDPAPGPGTGVVRRVGQTLGQLRTAGIAFPPVGVVVLQSVVAEMVSATNTSAGCDPAQYDAFEDWQIVDGCRVLFYTWPAEWATLPADDGSAAWHNLVANAVFEAERSSGWSGTPWLDLGLPVALLALDPGLKQPRFIDRYSVVRAGGRARPRTPIVDGAGTVFLWQARIQQLAAQLASPDLNSRAATIRDLGHQFRFLPPVGLLPRQILVHTDSTWTSPFFPDNYAVDAVPVPREQLNAVFRASAGLAGFDATVPDRVRVLVPVAQPWFDPHLLETATVDPIFQRSVDQAVQDRAVVLQRRVLDRTWASSVTQALAGHPLAFPSPDPDQLEPNEMVADNTLNPTEESQIAPVTNAALGDVVKPEQPLTDLATWLQTHTPLSDAERGQLTTNGLDQFVTLLESKINQTNDAIDFGFVRVQTDIYRARQVMLGNADATRLATSPVLATIAQGSTAIATRDAINQFLNPGRVTPAALAAPAAAAPADVAAAAPAAESAFAAAAVGNTFLSGELVRAVETTPTTGRVTVELGTTTTAVTATQTVSTPVALGTREITSQALQAVSHAKLFETADVSIDDIQQQQPVVGAPVVLRGVTIAERMKTPPAVEAKSYTVATRADVVGRLANLPINVDDVQIPGFVSNNAEVAIDFKTIRANNLVGEILAGKHDVNPASQSGAADDEASFFAGGVHALESTVSALRLIEGRVQAYQRALDVCRETQSALNRVRVEIDTRLKTLGDDLARARHAVATARALLQDEQTRISDINSRRLSILQEHVTFVAYHRPRTTDLLTFSAGQAAVPLRALDPGVSATVVPACLAQNEQIPPEIQAMVDLLREAPVRWFPFRRGVLDRFDDYDVLFGTLQAAKVRAQMRVASPSPFIPALPAPNGALLSNALGSVITAQRQVVSQLRVGTAQLDLGVLASQSWRTTRDLAEDHLSLGDLMDIGHGRSDVVQSAANELHDIARVATCLFLAFRDVDPRIRLVWAERLSQYSAPVDLQNLASLPRWGELSGVDRQSMQTMVDWLYQRLDPYRSDATATMNDLIRVCILLASHAPVDAILAGHVPQPAVIQPGGHVHLTVDVPGVQIGMHVLMYGGESGADIIGRGVVEDLTPGTAAARVLTLTPGAVSAQLTQNARVKFVTPNGVSGL